MQLICVFVFAYAKSRFSHDEVHIINVCNLRLQQSINDEYTFCILLPFPFTRGKYINIHGIKYQQKQNGINKYFFDELKLISKSDQQEIKALMNVFI